MISADTCTFPVNMPVGERSIWSRLAFQSDRSMGAEIRRLALRGLALELPAVACQIAEIRAAHKSAHQRHRTACALAMLGLLFVLICHDTPALRSRTARLRRRDVEECA